MRKSITRCALPILAFATALPLTSAANAAAYLFTLTGANTASFTLDSSPTPAAYDASSFTVQNATGTYNGAPTTFADLFFFETANLGGFDYGTSITYNINNILDLSGDQLFTGTTANPTFKLGTFQLSNLSTGAAYTLSITNGAVPEPATWAMMLMGFVAMGFAIRRKRHNSEVAAFA